MKTLRIFFLCIIIFTLFITSCGLKTTDFNKIEIVNTQNEEKAVITNDSETAKAIVNAINKKDKTEDDITSLFTYELYLINDSEVDSFLMCFDLENQNVYISKDDIAYKVKKDESKALFLDNNFNYIYIDNTIYNSYLNLNGNTVIPTIQYDWSYKNIDGHFNKKTGNLTENNEKLSLNKSDVLNLNFEKQPDSIVSRVYYGGNLIYTGKNLNDAIKTITYDGEFYIESEVQWFLKDNSNFYGKQLISFMADIDNPADFNIVTKENYPGNILIVSVENLNEDETVYITTDAVKLDTDVYLDGNKCMSIMPIDLYAAPGEYELSAIFNKGSDSEYIITKNLTILKKNFKTQYLTVSEEMNETNNDYKAIVEFSQVVKPARTESSDKKLWEGPFIMPVEGTLTTDFAEIRYVNNEPSSSRHSGIDLAASIGTEVKAPNNGRVTLAANGLLSPGNTLVIDHGLGLFTSYYHLDTILVKEGDVVEKGQVIATVGTTGFSTGPHLHYAVSIYNTYVNSYQPLSGIFD